MASDPSQSDIDRLREEVRGLARENAELRTLVEQQLVERGRHPLVQSGDPATRLAPIERERRMRVLRRLTVTLVMLAAGIVALILAAGPPDTSDGSRGTPTVTPSPTVAPVPAPPPVPPAP